MGGGGVEFFDLRNVNICNDCASHILRLGEKYSSWGEN